MANLNRDLPQHFEKYYPGFRLKKSSPSKAPDKNRNWGNNLIKKLLQTEKKNYYLNKIVVV